MRRTVEEVIHSESRSGMSKQDLERAHCEFIKKNYPPDFEQIGKEQFDRAIERQGLLTPRQLEVARLVALGLENKEIAAQLGVTEYCVKKHLAAVMLTAKVDGRTKVAQWFVGL
jgi:DNA-binding NarL/FixJ family response regulator